MKMESIKKYAAQMVPFHGIGKSDAQKATKALKSAIATRGETTSVSQVVDAFLGNKEIDGKKVNPTGIMLKDSTKAHVAIKLLSSRDVFKNDDVKQAGNHILTKLGAGEGGSERKSDALTAVFSHYQGKSLQQKVAGVALGASGIATIGAFAGAGPAGLIPLLVGVVPSATAFAKARKAGHRLAALDKQQINAGSVKKRAEAKAKADAKEADKAPASVAPSGPSEVFHDAPADLGNQAV